MSFPGTPLALMWHGGSVGDLVVPAGAVYGMESVLIGLVGSWKATATDVESHIVSST